MSRVLLILGSGSNVGQHVSQAFKAKGYKVALVARKLKEEDSTADQVNISSDLADPDSVVSVFSKVKELLGSPSVVVYNASAGTRNDPKDPLSVPLKDFERNLKINTTSVYAAAQQAVKGFEQLPDTASKTFIFTGNCLNVKPLAFLVDAGVGKTGTAHLIQSAASAYEDRGYKFYYADERKADGAPAFMDIDGAAHGKYYLELAESRTQGPWQQTFVKGVGYKQFESIISTV